MHFGSDIELKKSKNTRVQGRDRQTPDGGLTVSITNNNEKEEQSPLNIFLCVRLSMVATHHFSIGLISINVIYL